MKCKPPGSGAESESNPLQSLGAGSNVAARLEIWVRSGLLFLQRIYRR